MSIYTTVSKSVVDVLSSVDCGGTYVLRMEPVYHDVSIGEWNDAYERGIVLDQFYEIAQEQKRYWIWGPDIKTGLVFEVLDNGDLWTANRNDAISLMEFCEINFGKLFVWDNFYHDESVIWDCSKQQWVGYDDYYINYILPLKAKGDGVLVQVGFSPLQLMFDRGAVYTFITKTDDGRWTDNEGFEFQCVEEVYDSFVLFCNSYEIDPVDGRPGYQVVYSTAGCHCNVSSKGFPGVFKKGGVQ